MKTARIELRVSTRALKQWRLDAKAAGLTLSEWIRRRCEVVRIVTSGAGRYRIKWTFK